MRKKIQTECKERVVDVNDDDEEDEHRAERNIKMMTIRIPMREE